MFSVNVAKRFNLANMIDLEISSGNKREWSTGISLKHVYLIPRAKRLIIHAFTPVWKNQKTHCCEGDYYCIADNNTIAKIADFSGNNRVMQLLPDGSNSKADQRVLGLSYKT